MTTGPFAKLERAKQHLNEFKRACTEFVAEHPYVVQKQRKDLRRQTVRLNETPGHLGLIFGDFVHNLRSVLDHAVFEVTAQNAARLSKNDLKDFLRRASFPICTTADQWRSNPCSSGGLDKVGGIIPDGIAAIEGLQPFKDPNHDPKYHPLRLLAELDNRDKHRRLLATVTDIAAFRGETSPGHYWVAPTRRTIKGRAHPSVTVPRVDMKLQAFVAVLLAEGPAAGALLWFPEFPHPVIEALLLTKGTLLPDWLVVGVSEVLEALEPFL